MIHSWITAASASLRSAGPAKVKLGRGVNSLTNTTGRSEVWRKIKIVELLDLLQRDLRLAIQDNYIGKFQNSYDNKLLLITAVKLYLQALAKDQLIEDRPTASSSSRVERRWMSSTSGRAA